MLLRDYITPINRCCKCGCILHELDEFCELHWQEWLAENESESQSAEQLTIGEVESHIAFWSAFNPFAD